MIFPSTLLDTALNKARVASNDALVHKALHPPRIPKRPAQGNSRATSANRSADTSGSSPLTPRQQQTPRNNNQAANKPNKSRNQRRPFSQATGRSGNSCGKGKGSGKRSNRLCRPLWAGRGVPVAPLATVVRYRGRTLGGIRPPRQIPDTIQGSSSPPRKIPGSVPNVPAGFGARFRSPGRDQDQGVLEVVTDPDPGFYSRLFLVEKSSGGWRPVIDLLPLNEFVRQTPFRMETPNSVLLVVRKDDFLASIDLKDAYFQILVHPSSRKLLCFVSNGTVYQFRALFRVIDRSTSIHKSFHGGLVLGSLPRSPPATIPGRLADPVLLGGQDKATRESAPRTLLLPRHSHK